MKFTRSQEIESDTTSDSKYSQEIIKETERNEDCYINNMTCEEHEQYCKNNPESCNGIITQTNSSSFGTTMSYALLIFVFIALLLVSSVATYYYTNKDKFT